MDKSRENISQKGWLKSCNYNSIRGRPCKETVAHYTDKLSYLLPVQLYF